MSEKKIKILYIINNFSVGGAETMLLNLVSRLDRNKFDVVVGTVTGGGPLEQAFRDTGVKVLVYRKKSLLGLDVIRYYKKVMWDENPDIVHTHLWSADFWGRIAGLRSLRRPRIVSTEHNRNEHETPLHKVARHFLSYFTHAMIASSDAIKEYQVHKELIPKKFIKVIYYGIDTKRFAFRGVRVKKYGEPVVITTVGRLTKQKGQQYLIEAIAHFEQLGEDITLRIVGDGEDKEKLMDLVSRLRLNSKVTFAGIRHDMPAVWAESDVFVLPSLYEGLGIVLLEAMSVGVPVVASDIPAVRDVVKDHETGLLFESQNSDDLVEKVLFLLQNTQLQADMITRAREMVQEEYSVERMVREYEEVYEGVGVKGSRD